MKALGEADAVERRREVRLKSEGVTFRFELATKGGLGWFYAVNDSGASEIAVVTSCTALTGW